MAGAELLMSLLSTIWTPPSTGWGLGSSCMRDGMCIQFSCAQGFGNKWAYCAAGTFIRGPATPQTTLVPLRPASPQDNLESSTYETFEKDVTKYKQYEEAVYRALLDRVPQSEAGQTVTTLMVVGAGRGPLVRSSMQAAKRAGRRLRVYAVEKNPNAVVHIQAMLRREGWEDDVSAAGLGRAIGCFVPRGLRLAAMPGRCYSWLLLLAAIHRLTVPPACCAAPVAPALHSSNCR